VKEEDLASFSSRQKEGRGVLWGGWGGGKRRLLENVSSRIAVSLSVGPRRDAPKGLIVVEEHEQVPPPRLDFQGRGGTLGQKEATKRVFDIGSPLYGRRPTVDAKSGTIRRRMPREALPDKKKERANWRGE